MAGLRPWIQAFRLRTLPLAVSSILVGSALARFSGTARPVVLLAALLTAILLQVLSNLANDVGDHLHGTDNADRVGPARSVQSGAISVPTMKRAMLICGALAFLSGLWLIFSALGVGSAAWVFVLIGVLAIGAAVKYTYGTTPYGYLGLGDISVFLFFGIAGVMGTYYLHTRTLDLVLLLPAAAFGAMSAAVLNVNNMRDIRNDQASGKITLAVRLGTDGAKSYHGLLIVGAMVCLMLFTALNFRGMPQWGYLITTSVMASHLRIVLRNHDPAALDPELKRVALGTFATALAFSIGLWMV